jgi:hypothetical protein
MTTGGTFCVIDVIFCEDIRTIDFILKNIYSAFKRIKEISPSEFQDVYIETYSFDTATHVNPIDHCANLLNLVDDNSEECMESKQAFILVTLTLSTIIPILFSTPNAFTDSFKMINETVLKRYINILRSQRVKLETREITQREFVRISKSLWKFGTICNKT